MRPTPSKRPTLRDVASHAGVSFKTVSRVVNGESGVSDDLTVRVTEAVEHLGYRPDDRARHLRHSGAGSGTVGFVMVDVANPFFSSILRGIEEIARDHGYLVIAGSTDGDPDRQDQLIDAFVERRVDGLIVVASGETLGNLKREIDRGTPVVFLDLEPAIDDIDLVRSDHFGGAVTATRHLLAHGHRDIAFLGDHPSVFSAGQRLAGFHRAMTDAGIEVADHRVLAGHLTPVEWRGAIRDHLQLHGIPTALFTAQNYVTVGAAEALNDLGLRRIVAQIGFDDVDLAGVVEPGISVVPQRPWDLGRRAAELMFRRLTGDTAGPIRDLLVDPVIARGSGEIPGPMPTAARAVSVTLPGLREWQVAIHRDGDEHVSKRIADEGTWEPFETIVVRRLVQTGDLAVDAGANLGWFSMLLAACGAHVVAAEPLPANADLLAWNIAANGFAAQVAIHRIALGAVGGEAVLELSSRNQGDHRLSVEPTGRKSTVTVPVAPLDELLGGRRVDLIKLDTQGSEVAILQGGASVLHPGVVIVTEFWPYGLRCCGSSAAQLITQLKPLIETSHACFQVHEWASALTPLDADDLAEMAAHGGFSEEAKGFANLLLVPHDRVCEIEDLVRPPFDFSTTN